MSQTVVHVTTPSRLHFGMFSFGQQGIRQFGGVGLMIAEPMIRLRITAAERVTSSGLLAMRAAEFAGRVIDAMRLPPGAGCRIEIEAAPREHIGLGTGTQLGLAVAAGIQALYSLAPLLPADLARLAGRCLRSSIGTHGFACGGLLVEAGKHASGQVSPLIARLELPADWRFVLLMPKTATGLFGDEERAAFARVPPVPPDVTAALSQEVLLGLLPATIEADFDEFSQSLYRYGQLAGQCFASQQQGAFLDRRTSQLAETIRNLGTKGVGQSSWGPTLFAAVASESAGNELVAKLAATAVLNDMDCRVVRPDNAGAQIDVARLD